MKIVPLNITPADINLLAWLNQASPGDALEYHRGYLLLDRTPSNKHLSNAKRAELNLLASCAMRAAEHDLVHLVQRRLGESRFSYLAIARPRPKAAQATMALPLPEAA